MAPAPRIRIGDREELLYMLAEAAAIEHNVMCCYLYGIWSLKRGEKDGLTPEQAQVVDRWRRAFLSVAIEEMTHLAIVGNLTVAVGGAPHLSRPNFPIPAGYHPAAIDLELFGFSHALIDHAIFLERPEGIDLVDAPEFVHPDDYHRSPPKGQITPGSEDYTTIGHLYRGIYHGFQVLARKYGEAELFCGNPADQITRADAPLEGLIAINSLAEAHAAIETIVEQGEGAPSHSEDSHYSKFLAVRAELEAMLAADPSFAPAHPVARNPVSREPMSPVNRVWITDPLAAKVLDLGNAIYGIMLRFLAQSWGRDGDGQDRKALFMTLAREAMAALDPLGAYLATLPAGPEHPGVHAGMTFTMPRDVMRLPSGRGEMRMLAERMREIADHAGRLCAAIPDLARLPDMLHDMADRIIVPDLAPRKPPVPVHDDRPGAGRSEAAAPDPVSHAESRDLVLNFDTRRCIHARHCVLGAPEVFLANTPGDWLFPDKMSTSNLRGLCHTCPSGAITYDPKGATEPEPAPQVNTIRLRENGPYAVSATIEIDGAPDGFRATLCRCGQSKRKPYCDGSHKDAGFAATGEPDTRGTQALAARDGVLAVAPQHNGPLEITGNLEICAGTGRIVDRVTKVRLCRCGGSKTKPFCDNTHLKIGFKSD